MPTTPTFPRFALLVAAGAVSAAVGVGCAHDDDKPTPPPTNDAPPAAVPLQLSTKPSVHRLVVLHTSDNESDILGSAAAASAGTGEGRGGIGRAVSLVRALRQAANAPVLTVAAGDTLMPAPELKVEIDRKNAVAISNNLIGYDVSALGNHEFDNGESFLSSYIKQADFPYLSATVAMKSGPLQARHVGGGSAPPANVTTWAEDIKGKISTRTKVCVGKRVNVAAADPTVKRVACDGVTVGVVGATTERLRMLSSITDAIDVKDTLEEIRDVVQIEVDALRAQGVNIIVLLSHMQDIRKELRLIELGLVGVDIVVAGGGDDRLANKTHRLLDDETIPEVCTTLPSGTEGLAASCYPLLRMATDKKPVAIVATDGQLKYIGRLEVQFDVDGVLSGVDHVRSRPWPVDEMSLVELRVDLAKDALAFETQVRDYLVPLMHPVAKTSVFLDGTRESVRNRETNLGNLSSDSMMWAASRFAAKNGLAGKATPQFAMRNGGGIRASIGQIDADTSERQGGPIRRLDIESALRFDNALMLATTSHADLRSTLESALRGVGTGRGSFPQFSREVALTFHADASEQTHAVVDGKIVAVKCPGERVRSLSVTNAAGATTWIVRDGKTITPEQQIAFVTLAYMAKGGDGAFPAATDRVQTREVGNTEQGALVGFIDAELSAKTWNDAAAYKLPVPGQLETFKRVLRDTGPTPPRSAKCP